MREGFWQPRQGRNNVAQGESPGENGPYPPRPPPPPSGGGGQGRGSHSGPTACAVGYTISPAARADSFNEPLAQDTRGPVMLSGRVAWRYAFFAFLRGFPWKIRYLPACLILLDYMIYLIEINQILSRSSRIMRMPRSISGSGGLACVPPTDPNPSETTDQTGMGSRRRPLAPSGLSRRVLPAAARRRLAPTSSLPSRTLSTDWGLNVS